MQEMFTEHLEELKNKWTEINTTLEGIDSRITDAEEWITDQEERMVEITATKQNMEKRWEEISTAWVLGDKDTNIHIIEVPEGEERRDQKNYLKNNFVLLFSGMFHFFLVHTYVLIYIYMHICTHICVL